MKLLKFSILTTICIALILFSAGCTSNSGSSANSPQVTENIEKTIAPTPPPTPAATVSTPKPTVKPDTTTLGEKNALNKAFNYLAVMPVSDSGLVKQLEYEGYTNKEAVYGVDHCGADWNEQAALKAQDYLDLMSFSRDGLIDQLEYEGFTRQQAEYGVQAVGYYIIRNSIEEKKERERAKMLAKLWLD